jgi:hypothetical protein
MGQPSTGTPGALGYNLDGTIVTSGNSEQMIRALILGALQQLAVGGVGSGAIGATARIMSQPTSSGVAAQIVAAQQKGTGCAIVNTDASNTVWLGNDNTVTTGNGFPLLPGKSVSMSNVVAVWVIDNGSHALLGVISEHN